MVPGSWAQSRAMSVVVRGRPHCRLVDPAPLSVRGFPVLARSGRCGTLAPQVCGVALRCGPSSRTLATSAIRSSVASAGGRTRGSDGSAVGTTSRQHWQVPDEWVTSDEQTWPALVDRDLWERVNHRIKNTRGSWPSSTRRGPKANTSSLASSGVLHAAGQCTAPPEGQAVLPVQRSAAGLLADTTTHPRTTAVGRSRVLAAVDGWLNQLAGAAHRDATIASVLAADADGPQEPPRSEPLARALTNLPVELDPVLGAIRAGMDPKLAAATTKQIQLDLATAESTVDRVGAATSDGSLAHCRRGRHRARPRRRSRRDPEDRRTRFEGPAVPDPRSRAAPRPGGKPGRGSVAAKWWRGRDLNPRPSGYERPWSRASTNTSWGWAPDTPTASASTRTGHRPRRSCGPGPDRGALRRCTQCRRGPRSHVASHPLEEGVGRPFS